MVPKLVRGSDSLHKGNMEGIEGGQILHEQQKKWHDGTRDAISICGTGSKMALAHLSRPGEWRGVCTRGERKTELLQ